MQKRMKRAYLTAALASVVVTLLGAAAVAQSTDVGTWKLNLTKSMYKSRPCAQERHHED